MLLPSMSANRFPPEPDQHLSESMFLTWPFAPLHHREVDDFAAHSRFFPSQVWFFGDVSPADPRFRHLKGLASEPKCSVCSTRDKGELFLHGRGSEPGPTCLMVAICV